VSPTASVSGGFCLDKYAGWMSFSGSQLISRSAESFQIVSKTIQWRTDGKISSIVRNIQKAADMLSAA
jgi:hypothetical protein